MIDIKLHNFLKSTFVSWGFKSFFRTKLFFFRQAPSCEFEVSLYTLYF